MLETLSNLPGNSKLWVYQSPRPFEQAELPEIKNRLTDFLNDWTAHGASLQATFEIKYNRFIIIAVNEQQASASGCSIDKLVKFMKELGQLLQVDFFDRMHVAYRDDKNQIQSCSLQEFERLANQGIISESTIVFNNMVTTKKMFDTEWEVKLSQSWQKRVLA
jgi:hypothetical protein